MRGLSKCLNITVSLRIGQRKTHFCHLTAEFVPLRDKRGNGIFPVRSERKSKWLIEN